MLERIGLIIACLFLLGGCNLVQKTVSLGAPEGAKDAAIQAINQSLECKIASKGCKEVKIICSNPADLGAADKANGVTEKWCLKMSFIYGNQSKWHDAVSDAAVSNQHGKWAVEFLGHQHKYCPCGQRN